MPSGHAGLPCVQAPMTHTAIHPTSLTRARRTVLCASLLAALSCTQGGSSGNPTVVTAGTGADAPTAGSVGASASPPAEPARKPAAAGSNAGGAGGSPASNVPASIAGPRAPAAGSGGGSAGAAAGSGSAGMAAPTEPASNTWRMMGYDHRNWYLNPAETSISVDNAHSLTELWRFRVSGFPVGSPVIADGKVF